MSYVPQAPQGFAPFSEQVPLPGVAWDDPPLICVKINETWATYVLGACFALTKRSTWDTADPTQLDSVIEQATNLMSAIAKFEACPMIEFRINPDNSYYWDYSTDSGATWTRQPDTIFNFEANWQFDGSSPSGLKVTINNGQTFTNLPAVSVTDSNAILTDPLSLLRNTIDLGSGGVDGLLIKALATVGVALQQGGVAAFFQKIPGLGLAADTVVQIAGTNSYTNPLIETDTP